MKVWIKYLLGIALGIIAALILPVGNPVVADVIAFLTEFFIRIGRYTVIPVVFCTAIVSINKLRSSKLVLNTVGWTILLIVLSSLILTVVGLISILIVKLPLIPITNDAASGVYNLNIKQMILSLFPTSAFEALKDGSFLLVSFVFACMIGWESASSIDTPVFKPVFQLADSCSKLFYNIAVFFTEAMSIFMVAIMCNWTITYRSIISTGIYTPMIIMFLCDFILVVGVIYPLILRFVCHDPHPYKVLFASFAPTLLGFFSGDANLVLPLSIRHGKESLGIRRRCGGFTYPMFSIFARGGSALVVVISFISIWRSYSRLSLSVTGVLWIVALAFGLSFLLGGLPSGSAFVLLTIMCSKYAKGLDTSYMLLQPASLMICSFATAFDVVTAMFGSYIVAVKTKMIEHHSLQHFI